MLLPTGLLLLADARLPTGGHAHSAGTESAVSIGDVCDLVTLDRYLTARLATTGNVDAAFAAWSCRELADGPVDGDRSTLDVEYSARVPSPYLRAVSRRLGRQLARTAVRLWPSPALTLLASTPDGPHQAVVLGAAAAAAGGGPDDAAALAVHQLAGAVTSAAVRLLGLDPVDAAALHAVATQAAIDRLLRDRPWEVDDPADLPADGGSLTEILGEHHGSLAARLFVA